MAALPQSIVQLITSLRQLPGIGPRSAERIALDLVQSAPDKSYDLAKAITEARQSITLCSQCGSLTEADPCPFCSDAQRDGSVICVVERPVDVLSIDKSGTYHGMYHVLCGKISPLDGVGAEDLRITQLEQRLMDGSIKEVIIALGTDVEGDATSHYLSQRLSRKDLKVTRIAHGLPAGSGLEFADNVTLAHALDGRREF